MTTLPFHGRLHLQHIAIMNTVATRPIFQGCALWSALPTNLVLPMMRELKPIVFPPKHVVISEGEQSSGLYFIEQGQARRRNSAWHGHV